MPELSQQELSLHTNNVTAWWFEPYTGSVSPDWLVRYRTANGTVHTGSCHPTIRDVIVCNFFPLQPSMREVLVAWSVVGVSLRNGDKVYNLVLTYHKFGAVYDAQCFTDHDEAVQFGTKWFGFPPEFVSA